MHKPRRTAVLHDAACESANKEQHGEVSSMRHSSYEQRNMDLDVGVCVHADVAVAVAVCLVAVV